MALRRFRFAFATLLLLIASGVFGGSAVSSARETTTSLLLAAASSGAALPAEWWKTMPAPSRVRSETTGADQLDALARQAATFDRLKDVVISLGDRQPGGGWQRTKPAGEQAALYRQYNDASSAALLAALELTDDDMVKRRPFINTDPNTPSNRWRARYRQYGSDFKWNEEVLRKFVPAPVLAGYQEIDYVREGREGRERYARETAAQQQQAAEARQQAAQAQQKAAGVAALKRRVDADKHAGVDRKVFGIELGEPLALPPCGESVTAIDVMLATSFAQGPAKTCISEYFTRVAGGVVALGVVPSTSLTPVGVRIANSACPLWARTAKCLVFLSVKEGLVLGARLVPVARDDVFEQVMKQLTRKYGEPSRTGKASPCVNRMTGMVTGESKRIYWTRPGLHVTYEPTDCEGEGTVWFELDYLVELLKQEEETRDETEPQV
jgi:hypothetical protein